MINVNESKYDGIKEKIRSLYRSGESFDNLYDLKFMQVDPETGFKLMMLTNPDINFPPDAAISHWNQLVEYIKSKKGRRVSSLATGAENNAQISNDPGSQWVQYRNALMRKNFSSDSIQNIEDSSFQILRRLNKKTLETGPVKGLVVGNVQSGKTANMIGLMSMAADYGFNFFIIFSGVIENLRKQTSNRMYEDLNLDGNLKWTQLHNPNIRSQAPESKWENIDVRSGSSKRYFAVTLKNKNRMEALINWLYEHGPRNDLKVLIIDDEADQASINTLSMDNECNRTAINDAMIRLVHGYEGKNLGAVNYISYTATPYANVLNETEGLFPKDFVFTLPVSGDYIGPEEIFGLEEPETNSKLPIVRTILDEEREEIQEVHKGVLSIPESMKESITWFFITAAVSRIYNRKSPVSMLIHTSHKIVEHSYIEKAVRKYLLEIRENKEKFLGQAETLYNRETVDLTKEDFINGMENYSASVRDYPEFEQIRRQMLRVLEESLDKYVTHIPLNDDGSLEYHEGFHLVIDNSGARAEDEVVRLIYPSSQVTKLAPMFIVIGGNTLSRGLTLEGLTTSYFLRTTTQADTLMQMGRWFGYRKGYELLPRIWLDNKARNRFQLISQINRDLVEEIEDMSLRGGTPGELGIKVKNSPDNALLRITSKNKMQGAIETDLDFTGINKQTTILTNDLPVLDENKKLVQDFLNQLDEPVLKKSLLLWENVKFEKVKSFLENFKFSTNDIFFSTIETFVEWFENAQSGDEKVFADWSVILASTGLDSSAKDTGWEIHNYRVQPVMRTRRYDVQEDGKTVSIGALRSPSHLLADLPEQPPNNITSNTGVRRYRGEQGYGDVPQLIIYPIDRNSKPDPETDSKRYPLGFDQDPVGINLYIPGNSTSKNLATHLRIKINDDFDAEDFVEDGNQ